LFDLVPVIIARCVHTYKIKKHPYQQADKVSMTIPFEIATQFRCIPPPFEKSLETLDNLQESH
jgi:hypothetical protein